MCLPCSIRTRVKVEARVTAAVIRKKKKEEKEAHEKTTPCRELR